MKKKYVTDSSMTNELKNKPSGNAFKQQKLPAWQPIFTAEAVIPTLFIIGLAFLPIGIGLYINANNVDEKKIDYTDCSPSGQAACHAIIAASNNATCSCRIEFTLDDLFESDVYVYYGLNNYFQNLRQYSKSYDDNQLAGYQDFPSKSCEPLDYAFDPAKGYSLPIAPCGAIANSLFSDSFKLYHIVNETKTEMTISSTEIAWPTDKMLYKNPPSFADTTKPPNWQKYVDELDGNNSQNNGYLNERLMVWMKISAFSKFRKLWGRIVHTGQYEQGLPAGNYTVDIEYSYQVKSFGGEKFFILSNTSWLGGKSYFLAIGYTILGSLCIVLSLTLLLLHKYRGHTLEEIMDVNPSTQFRGTVRRKCREITRI